VAKSWVAGREAARTFRLQGLAAAVTGQQQQLACLSQQLLGAAGAAGASVGGALGPGGRGGLASLLVGLLPRHRTLVAATLQSTAPLSMTGGRRSTMGMKTGGQKG
jgi:hypothetical protein